jgi:hypothetical protein
MVQAFYGRNAGHPRWGRRAKDWRDLPRERVRGLALPLAGAAVDGLVLLPRDLLCTVALARAVGGIRSHFAPGRPRGAVAIEKRARNRGRASVCALPKTARERAQKPIAAATKMATWRISHPPPSIDIIGQSSAAASQPISRPTIELGLELGELPRPEHQEH